MVISSERGNVITLMLTYFQHNFKDSNGRADDREKLNKTRANKRQSNLFYI